MAGNSDMEISDDDSPPPSSVGSCLQTHPPTHQEAHDFLSSLLLATDGEGVLPGEGPVDEEGAGVCPGARPVHPEEGSLVAMIPDVDPPDSWPNSRHGQDGGRSAVPDGEGPHLSGHSPGGTDGPSRRQRQQSRKLRHKWAKRNAETAASFLR